MTDHYSFQDQPRNPATGLPWNPSTEIYPGGPHPGAVHLLHEEQFRRQSEEDAHAVARATEIRNHLLLLR